MRTISLESSKINFVFFYQLYYWDTSKGHVVEAPRFISKSFQALLGGIFFDSSMNIDAVTTVSRNAEIGGKD